MNIAGAIITGARLIKNMQPDRRVPARLLLMPFRGLMEKSASSFIRDYIKEEDNVLDLGSGPGFFTVKIAKKVGPQGRVYAVDADENSIDILLRRIKELSLSNVTPIIASADDLSFISDEAIDVVFSNKTLCCIRNHLRSINEIIRVMKKDGIAYMSVSRPALDPLSVDSGEWSLLLSKFQVIRKGSSLTSRWAIVKKLN